MRNPQYNPEGLINLLYHSFGEFERMIPMENLVQVAEGQVVVSSRQVAEHFEKQHCHVLEAIENLVIENSIAKFFFKNLLTFARAYNIMKYARAKVR